MESPEILEGQDCPMCNKKTLTLAETVREIPYFGKVFLFSMTCGECKYHKADLECAEEKDSSKYTFEVSSKDDLSVRVVKSAEATIKIPHIMTIESGPASNGFVTNVEGILNRVRSALESARENEAEDANSRKKLKNMIKKINNALWGHEKIKIIIEDKTGNSAIISDKAVRAKLK